LPGAGQDRSARAAFPGQRPGGPAVMTATIQEPGSRVSPGAGRRAAMPLPRDGSRQPFRVYARDPDSGLLVSDGLTYRGERVALREARKITRVLGQPAEARPA